MSERQIEIFLLAVIEGERERLEFTRTSGSIVLGRKLCARVTPAMSHSTWVKICGVTLPEDVELLASVGANAVGLNFVAWSKRLVSVAVARELAAMVRGRMEVIGVVSDLEDAKIQELVREVRLDRVQLHGAENPAQLERLGALAFKAVGIASESDVARARAFPGDLLLVDTAVGHQSGGTGKTFDWRLVEELCRVRRVVVAGGLHPGNVGEAISTLHPYGVDVASGVEPKGKPGRKDPDLVARLLSVVRQMDAGVVGN